MPSDKKEKFSLKDALFDPQKVEMMAHKTKEVYPAFHVSHFTKETLEKFPKQEHKERI